MDSLFLLLASLSIASHVAVLYLLALRRAQQAPYRKPDRATEPSLWAPRNLATLSTATSLLLPYTITDADPLLQSGLRVVCFFYACKLLDLVVNHAESPPTRLGYHEPEDEREKLTPAPIATNWDTVTYIWLLLTEMRYRSFDIAVMQKGRPQTNDPTGGQQLLHTLIPLALLPALAYLLPIPETKCAALLLLIQYGLSGMHKLMHPRCPDPLFYNPFSATSLSDFWTTRWHASASPFLRSLAYQPARKVTGSRAVGVLAAFCLSGVWHGWASAPLVMRPWVLGMQVWGLFIGFGVGCLVEQWVSGEKQGGMVQRVCVWVYCFGAAGVCWRTLERYSRIGWLKNG